MIAAQWDYAGNVGTPDSVVAQSHQPLGWLCDACGHKWSASPNHWTRNKTGCSQCANANAKGRKKNKQQTFAECKVPEVRALLAQWDHARNAEHGHVSDKVRLQSAKQIFWLCTKCPAGQEHSWPAQPYNRMARNKTGCPPCAGKTACKCNSLQTLWPDIAAEWDYAKNGGQPNDYTAGSKHLACWVCPQRGSWQQSISHVQVTCSKRMQGWSAFNSGRSLSVSFE